MGELTPFAPVSWFDPVPDGVSVGIADRDGDGKADLLVSGPPMQNKIRSYKGATLSFLNEFTADAPEFLGGVFVG